MEFEKEAEDCIVNADYLQDHSTSEPLNTEEDFNVGREFDITETGGLDNVDPIEAPGNALLDLHVSNDLENGCVEGEVTFGASAKGTVGGDAIVDPVDTEMGLEDDQKTDQVMNVDYKALKAEEEQQDIVTFGREGANNSESMVADPSPPRTPRDEEDSGVRCCDYALCRCLRRVPYATLFAFLLLAGGLALMTYEIIMIQDTANELFAGTVLYANHSGYKKGLDLLLWLLIALVTIISLFGLFFLVLACFSSGPSKKNTCGKRFVKCVNRVSISVVTIVAYLLCIAWIALSMALMLGLTFMLMVRSYCNHMEGAFSSDSCIDLAQYGMAPSKPPMATTVVPMPSPSSNHTQTTICGDRLENFCKMHEDIQLNVWLTVTASIIVIISLIHFLMALAANHTYMRIFRKGYRSVPKGTNAFPGFRYSDGELPIQEPVNVNDENTQF